MFWQIVITEGIAVTLIGSLLHFMYVWSGRNRIMAIFAAVNESTWEHIKLALSGIFVCTLADVWVLGADVNYWLARSLSFLVPVVVIPALFYGYRHILKPKKTILALDITIFVIAAFAAAAVFAAVLGAPAIGTLGSVLSIAISVAIIAAYLLLTRFPLRQNFLFKDPITGRYGMPEKVAKKSQKAGTRGSKKRDWIIWLITLAMLAVIGVVTGIRIADERRNTAAEVVEVVEEVESEPQPLMAGELEIPNEIPQSERDLAANYHVAADQPRLISIPNVGIYARIVTVGKVNGAVDTPEDIRVVAWYNRSSLPGQPGASLLDGHGGSYGNGIFNGLQKIAVGDKIYIEMGDETTRYVYNVVEVLWLTRGTEADNYMSTALKPVASGVPTLTLITCAGGWLPAEQTYLYRIFVRATLEYETRE